MPDDAQDAIAGEYVLGTLSGDEREHAEALMAIDPGFADSVRRWERRLGELNVMVEAVEPPPEVWDKIKAAINPAPPQPAEVKPTADELSRSALLAPALEPKPEAKPEPSFEPQLEAQPEAKAEPVLPFEPTLPPASTLPPAPPPPLPAPVPEFDLDDGRIEPRLDLGLEPRSETLPETRPETTWPEGRAEPPSPADTLAASLLPSTDEDELPAGVSESITASLAEQLSVPPAEERARRAEPQVDRRLEPPIDNRIEQRMERSAEIIYLSRRVARWRRLTMAMAAVAALLALYVGVSRFVPASARRTASSRWRRARRRRRGFRPGWSARCSRIRTRPRSSSPSIHRAGRWWCGGCRRHPSAAAATSCG